MLFWMVPGPSSSYGTRCPYGPAGATKAAVLNQFNREPPPAVKETRECDLTQRSGGAARHVGYRGLVTRVSDDPLAKVKLPETEKTFQDMRTNAASNPLLILAEG